MSNLGQLSAHHFRPGFSDPGSHSVNRGAIGRASRPACRSSPAVPVPYLLQWAHYPVRINGREAPFYGGSSSEPHHPWPQSPAPQTDANGRLFHHAHRVPLQWFAGAGARSITAKMRHTFAAGPYPRIALYARNDLGIADQIATATATTGADQNLTLNFTMPIAANVQIWLECANTEQGGVTTWDTLTTT